MIANYGVLLYTSLGMKTLMHLLLSALWVAIAAGDLVHHNVGDRGVVGHGGDEKTAAYLQHQERV